MAENLSVLIIGIIDHLDAMETEQEFLQLCQNELDQPDEKTEMRLRLLLSSYQTRLDYHFDELRWRITRLKPRLLELKKLIGGMVQDDG